MGIFIDPDATVEVWDDAGKNCIVIRAMMGSEILTRIEDSLYQVRQSVKPKRARGKVLRKGQQVEEAAEEGVLVEVHSGTVKLLLLEENIVSWHGEEMNRFECNRRNIRRVLNLRAPFVQKVLYRIDELNAEPELPDHDEAGTDPNFQGPNGSTIDGTARLREMRESRQAS